MCKHVDEHTEGKQETHGDHSDSPEFILGEVIQKWISHIRLLVVVWRTTRYIRYIVPSSKSFGDYSM